MFWWICVSFYMKLLFLASNDIVSNLCACLHWRRFLQVSGMQDILSHQICAQACADDVFYKCQACRISCHIRFLRMLALMTFLTSVRHAGYPVTSDLCACLRWWRFLQVSGMQDILSHQICAHACADDVSYKCQACRISCHIRFVHMLALTTFLTSVRHAGHPVTSDLCACLHWRRFLQVSGMQDILSHQIMLEKTLEVWHISVRPFSAIPQSFMPIQTGQLDDNSSQSWISPIKTWYDCTNQLCEIATLPNQLGHPITLPNTQMMRVFWYRKRMMSTESEFDSVTIWAK